MFHKHSSQYEKEQKLIKVCWRRNVLLWSDFCCFPYDQYNVLRLLRNGLQNSGRTYVRENIYEQNCRCFMKLFQKRMFFFQAIGCPCGHINFFLMHLQTFVFLLTFFFWICCQIKFLTKNRKLFLNFSKPLSYTLFAAIFLTVLFLHSLKIILYQQNVFEKSWEALTFLISWEFIKHYFLIFHYFQIMFFSCSCVCAVFKHRSVQAVYLANKMLTGKIWFIEQILFAKLVVCKHYLLSWKFIKHCLPWFAMLRVCETLFAKFGIRETLFAMLKVCETLFALYILLVAKQKLA